MNWSINKYYPDRWWFQIFAVFSPRSLGKWSQVDFRIFFKWLETTHTFNIDLHWTKNAWHLRVQKAQPGGPKLSPSGLVTFLGVSPIPRSWTWDPREETCRKEHGCLGCIRDYTTQIYGDSFTMARWYIGRVCLGYVGMCFLLFYYRLFRAYRGWTPTQAYRDYFHTPLKGSLLNNQNSMESQRVFFFQNLKYVWSGFVRLDLPGLKNSHSTWKWMVWKMSFLFNRWNTPTSY